MNWRGGRRRMTERLTIEVLRRLEGSSNEDITSRASFDTNIALPGRADDSIERLFTMDTGHFRQRIPAIHCSPSASVYAWCHSPTAHGTHTAPFNKNRILSNLNAVDSVHPPQPLPLPRVRPAPTRRNPNPRQRFLQQPKPRNALPRQLPQGDRSPKPLNRQ